MTALDPALPALLSDSRHTPTLGVAFGGGGMKGWAHLGVISMLERLHLRPDVMAACSAGALIAAYYAAGHTMEQMTRFMQEQHTASLFSLRFDGLGLLSADALRAYLHQHFGEATFADLTIPFCVVCTDLEAGKEVVLDRGSLVEALLASSALPGIFPPVELDGRLLVDGGLTNNMPVSALVNRGARYTIGVRLRQERTGLDAPSLKRDPDAAGDEGSINLATWTERLKRTFRRETSHLPNGFEVVNRALEIVMSQLEAYRLQVYRPDVLITPRVDKVGTFSFSEEKEDIFNRGREAAEAQAPLLEELARRLGRTLPGPSASPDG